MILPRERKRCFCISCDTIHPFNYLISDSTWEPNQTSLFVLFFSVAIQIIYLRAQSFTPNYISACNKTCCSTLQSNDFTVRMYYAIEEDQTMIWNYAWRNDAEMYNAHMQTVIGKGQRQMDGRSWSLDCIISIEWVEFALRLRCKSHTNGKKIAKQVEGNTAYYRCIGSNCLILAKK